MLILIGNTEENRLGKISRKMVTMMMMAMMKSGFTDNYSGSYKIRRQRTERRRNTGWMKRIP